MGTARNIVLLLAGLVLLAACGSPATIDTSRGDVYRISPLGESRVQFRMLDSVNALRQVNGLGPVELNSELNAASKTHSQDMALQNRPWHFGSDGSSPADRVLRVGYPGRLLGENISESFETELETLNAWMELQETRDVILAPEATEMGFSWLQEDNNKIWWTLVMGTQSGVVTLPSAAPVANSALDALAAERAAAAGT